MIFVQFWWALLVFNSPGLALEAMDGGENKNGGQVSEQLQSFSRAVEKAGPELQELWSSFGAMQDLDNLKEQPRERRNTLDDMLASFAQAPVEGSKAEAEKDIRAWQEEADAWYRDIQAKNANSQKRMGGKQERSAIKTKEGIEQHSESKYKEVSDDANIQKQEVPLSPKESPSHLDAKLKPVPVQTPNEHENLKSLTQSQVKAVDAPKKVEAVAEKLPELRDAPVADGVYESTLNRLAFRHEKSNKLDHEANYKLSKIEQEASEKLPKFPRAGSLDKDNVKQQKRRSSGGLNPMDEIKLKTSCRMIAKGYGPLLPSETYDISRRRKLEDWEPQQYESNQDQDRRMNMKRFEPQNDNYEYNQFSKGTAVDSDQMMDLPQRYDYKAPQYDRFYSVNQRDRLNVLDYERNNRMPIDREGFNREPSMGTSSQGNRYKSGMGSSSLEAIGEPAMKPSNLETEVKSRLARSPLEGEEDQKVPEHKIKEAPALGPSKEHESKEKEAKLEDSHDYPKLDADMLAKAESFFVQDKLKNEPEAAAPTTNLDAEATSKLVANQDAGGGRSPRHTRRVKRSLEEYPPPEQQEPHVTKRKAQLLDDFEDHNGNRASFGVLGNGMLTPDAEELGGKTMSLPGHELLTHYNDSEATHDNDSRKDIFNVTKYRPNLHNFNLKDNFNLSHIFNESPQSMLKKQPSKPTPSPHGGRRATYIYDLIVQTAEEQQKYFKERQNSLRVLGEVFRQDKQLIDPSKIPEKTQLVKKLLRRYQGLPLEEQLAATDMLLLDLDYLRKIAGTAVRSQRNALLFEVLRQEDMDETLEQMTSKYNSRFIKLLKTAEFFQKMGQGELWHSLMV